MRTLIVFLLCVNSVYAQWQQFHRTDFGLTYGLTSPDAVSRHFRINSYDNSLWMCTQTRFQSLGTGDAVQSFGFGHPDFQAPFQFSTFEFLTGKVFISNTSKGVYLYENETISMIYTGVHSGITTYGDTLYILRQNSPMVKWVDGSISYLFNTGFSRIITVKDDFFWVSEGFDSTGGMTVYSDDGNYNWYNPVTSLLMDFGNFGFKFSPQRHALCGGKQRFVDATQPYFF